MDDVKLTFDNEALELIVDKAIEYKLGARGLRSIVETVMTDIMFDLPAKRGTSVTISRDTVEKNIGKIETLKS